MIGFLNVYKPQNMSSAAVVGKIKKQFNLKKVGHMGTLDPLACGILPIAIGKATRMFDYFLNKSKQYIVECEFGYETPSLDLGTEPNLVTNVFPNRQDVENSCKSFVGKISQLPPIYSAKNVNGEKAYDLARSGKSVELKPVVVEIFRFECLCEVEQNKFRFLIECSSGTYVRSLIRDLAYKLNSLATVTFLERSESGVFNKENSVNLNNLLNSNLNDYCLSIQSVFQNIKTISVNDSEFFKLKNGLTVNIELENDANVFILYKTELLGVATVENGSIKLKTYLLED